MTRHGFRFSLFALIGGGVFIAGLGLQVLLVRYAGLGPDWAYAAQAVFSIELSYLFNRYLTWRDRSAGFWVAAWKFNVQKLLMTVVTLTAYALLVRAGVEYVLANVVLTAIFTPVNYFAADLLVFVRGGRHAGGQEHTVEPKLPEVLPTVSVVIPCRNSGRTIRATVESFLAQDYPALSEVILVGDVSDPTWAALADVKDSRLVLIEQEKTPGRRDPNVKRDKGIKKSAGDVIALADSDIVVDPGWLGRAVALLSGQGGGLVAGGMRSMHDTFWGRFVDNNVMAAKTPRVPRPYRVTAENFGTRGCKPPITANAVFTRDLYDSVQLDVAWAYGYEDYEWFWRLAKGGHDILFVSELTAAHHHRRSFRHLVREYRQSAHGCAQFIRVHPDSPLAKKRAVQAFGLPVAAFGALGLGSLAVANGYGALVAGLLAMAAVLVTGREVGRARSLESLTYPPVAMALGGVYAATIAGNLLRPAERKTEAPRWNEGDSPRRRWQQRLSWPLAAILTVQAGLSLSLVWSNTAFADEALFLKEGHLEWRHWLHGTSLPVLHAAGAPQIYPAIGAVADKIGGLAGARILSMLFMLIATALLYATGKRLFGTVAAFAGTVLWAVSEPVLRLAYATFDPLACLLIIASAYLSIRSAYTVRKAELVLLSGMCLALASVTAEAYAIDIPAVMIISFFTWYSSSGRASAVRFTAWQGGISLLASAGLLTVLHLWQDALVLTSAARAGAVTQGASLVLRAAWSWDGLIFGIAIAGAILAIHARRGPLVMSLVFAVILVPTYQVHLGTAFAMDKNMSAGSGLAALAAGYGISKFRPTVVFGRISKIMAVIALISVPAVTGIWYAKTAFNNWPNLTRLLVVSSSFSPGGPILINNKDGSLTVSIFDYYLPKNDWVGNNPGEDAKIKADQYAGVVMALDSSQLQSQKITTSALHQEFNLADEVLTLAAGNNLVQTISSSHHYFIASVIPYATANSSDSVGVFVIWQRIPTAHPALPQRVIRNSLELPLVDSAR